MLGVMACCIAELCWGVMAGCRGVALRSDDVLYCRAVLRRDDVLHCRAVLRSDDVLNCRAVLRIDDNLHCRNVSFGG